MPIYLKEKIIPAQKINNAAPVNLIPEDKFLFEHNLVKELPEVSLYYLRNVNVTPQGILFKGLHLYKQFLIWPSHVNEFNVLYLLKNYLKRKAIIANPGNKYLVCFDYWTGGYFHWMCDFLPKLITAESHLVNYTLLLPENYKQAFVEESLKAFGIKNVMRFSENEFIKCSVALVPERVTRSGDNNPQVMQMIRKKFFDYFKPTINQSSPKNIYVSRAKSRGRVIQNEDELTASIEAMGFTTVYFEDHTYAEQVNIAFNCKNMVGLHGANLTNLLFMQPNANLLELRLKNDNKRNYYFSLASTFSVNYFYLQCQAVTENPQVYPDLRVNVAALKKEVEGMLIH